MKNSSRPLPATPVVTPVVPALAAVNTVVNAVVKTAAKTTLNADAHVEIADIENSRVFVQELSPEQREVLLVELLDELRRRRQEKHAADKSGGYTQAGLSKALGYVYSAVALWENRVRAPRTDQALAWAAALGMDGDWSQGPLAAYAQAAFNAGIKRKHQMPDHEQQARKRSTQINVRMAELRQTLRLTMREMAQATGLPLSAVLRVEQDQSVLSVEHLLRVCKKLHVGYDWLLEGKGTWNDERNKVDEIKLLRRENEILESFRQQVMHERARA